MRINSKNFHPRKLDRIPPHFKTIALPNQVEYHQQKTTRWIHAHCAGRFALVNDVQYQNDQVTAVTNIGFEEPSDLTLFLLSGMAQNVGI
jgi:hypothetical protein